MRNGLRAARRCMNANTGEGEVLCVYRCEGWEGCIKMVLSCNTVHGCWECL